MFEDVGLKIEPSSKFHENLPSGSKVISGKHTQTGDLISLLSFKI
jgi:hypothetical protein